MSHGYSEIRTVKMEPGPDGKPVPHVYIERRELGEEEARKIMEDHASVFQSFDEIFSGFDGLFARMDALFKNASSGVRKAFGRHGR